MLQPKNGQKEPKLNQYAFNCRVKYRNGGKNRIVLIARNDKPVHASKN